MNRKSEAASTIYVWLSICPQLCSPLTSQNFLFNKFNFVDVNISSHTSWSMARYSLSSFSILKFSYFKFKTMVELSALFEHHIITCSICNVSAMNEEHYSNLCEAVCNIYKYLYTNLPINTYIHMKYIKL